MTRDYAPTRPVRRPRRPLGVTEDAAAHPAGPAHRLIRHADGTTSCGSCCVYVEDRSSGEASS